MLNQRYLFFDVSGYGSGIFSWGVACFDTLYAIPSTTIPSTTISRSLSLSLSLSLSHNLGVFAGTWHTARLHISSCARWARILSAFRMVRNSSESM